MKKIILVLVTVFLLLIPSNVFASGDKYDKVLVPFYKKMELKYPIMHKRLVAYDTIIKKIYGLQSNSDYTEPQKQVIGNLLKRLNQKRFFYQQKGQYIYMNKELGFSIDFPAIFKNLVETRKGNAVYLSENQEGTKYEGKFENNLVPVFLIELESKSTYSDGHGVTKHVIGEIGEDYLTVMYPQEDGLGRDKYFKKIEELLLIDGYISNNTAANLEGYSQITEYIKQNIVFLK